MRIVDVDRLTEHLTPLVDLRSRVVVSGNFATPHVLLHAVDRVLPRYRLWALNAQPGVPEREGVTHETPFVGAGVRHSERLEYIPARLSLVPRMFARTCIPDVVLLHVAPPRKGKVSLGVEVNVLPAAVEQARLHGRLVIAQINPDMPWTSGDAELPVDMIDLAIEAQQPLTSPTPRVPGEVESVIGQRVAGLVADRSTLQLGIGGVPDATLSGLTGRRLLRVWTEMVSDGILGLERAGSLDPDAPLVASFLFGSAELYAWAHDNPRLRMLRTEITNDPGRIAEQPMMTSVNSALQVDLYAQANASWVRGRIYSGFGGQSDFVVGALHSPGGQAVVALPSWHPRADRSTIVPVLDGPATSFQHSWVVTEQGAAAITPEPFSVQVRNLVRQAAHPAARPELEEVMGRMHLRP
ncbi:MAG: 4-hydroxybutyrate CoA-transferase [Frankiales bacterium]|nr:MAG: 4-hydroxybutyrate CoA-transferase [Frankiales bacterium]